MNKNKTNVLFVGSFVEKHDDDRIGGQMVACGSIIKSDMRESINWYLLDTSAVLPPQHVVIRGLKALRRVLKIIFLLIRHPIDRVLIFTSGGQSFIEKGLMVRIAKWLSADVVLAPRSGLILRDLKKKNMRNYVKSTFKKADSVICQSDGWKQTFLALDDYSPDKFVVIPNWVDTEIYKKSVIHDESNTANSSPSKIRMLYLGLVKDYKGIFDLLDALRSIKDEVPHLVLDVCGNGDDLERCKSLCAEYQISHRVSFYGWVDFEGKLSHLNKADIFVLPSHYEGFPNVLLEAMSFGLPVIATDVGGVSSLVDHANNGLLIPPNSIAELSDSILQLYNDKELRAKYGNEARSTVEENFQLDLAMKRFQAVLT